MLLGHPVAHSLSPAIHNAALAATGIALRYTALDVASTDLAPAVSRLARENAAGNVTIPYKAAVAARCSRVTPVAGAAGAVNTWWVEEGELIGDNTDVAGFDLAARRLLADHGRELPSRVSVIGAGGAAAAVLVALSAWPGCTATVSSRTEQRALELVRRFDNARVEPDLARAVGEAELVVNATPMGMDGEIMPVELIHLSPDAAVLDLVYRPGRTEWVRRAAAAGHPAADGLVMLVEQAAASFVRWFGLEPDREAMWQGARNEAARRVADPETRPGD